MQWREVFICYITYAFFVFVLSLMDSLLEPQFANKFMKWLRPAKAYVSVSYLLLHYYTESWLWKSQDNCTSYDCNLFFCDMFILLHILCLYFIHNQLIKLHKMFIIISENMNENSKKYLIKRLKLMLYRFVHF